VGCRGRGHDSPKGLTDGVRGIPVHPVLVRPLVEYIAGRSAGLLVATRTGKPIALSNLARSYRNAGAVVGIAPGGRRHL
jgi:hypothetical protein